MVGGESRGLHGAPPWNLRWEFGDHKEEEEDEGGTSTGWFASGEYKGEGGGW